MYIIPTLGGTMATTPQPAAAQPAAAQPAAGRRGRQGGPPLLAPALAYAVLAIVATILLVTTPHPGASGGTVLAYDRAHRIALEVAGFVIFGAAAPLAIWAATVY